MEFVERDLSVGKVFGGADDEGRQHVHTDFGERYELPVVCPCSYLCVKLLLPARRGLTQRDTEEIQGVPR